MSKQVYFYLDTDQSVAVRGLRLDLPVSSMTQAGGVATVKSEAHGVAANDVVCVQGAKQRAYNGDHVVTGVPTEDTFTFAVDASAYSPASGDILCGAYLGDATVAAAMERDDTGDPVSGAEAVTFRYKVDSNGMYVGTIPANAVLVESVRYRLTITCTATTGEVFTERLVGPAIYAGA